MASSLISLVQLIREFRALQAKDSVTPESLSYLLQRIVDILATVETEDFGSEILQLFENFQTKGTPVVGIRQGTSNASNVYTIIDYVDFYTGESLQSSSITIPQASTTRAGAMTAIQVTDLNTAKNNINNTILPKLQTHDTSINSLNSTIQSHTTQIQSIESKNQTQDSKIQALENKNQFQDNEISTFKNVLWIDEKNNISSVVNNAQISCTIVNGKVHVNGASKFIEAGFVPYLFSRTRKKNPFNDDNRTLAQKDQKYCQKKKGWHLWGSCNSVRINSEVLQFSTNSHEYLHKVASGYTSDTSAIIKIHINKWRYKTIPWGRSTIIVNNLRNSEHPDKMRMIKLPFAVAFGKKILPGQTRVTPALMVSNLAEFSIIYDPSTKKWLFSR